VILYQYNHQREQLETVLDGFTKHFIFGGSDKQQAIDDFTRNPAPQLLVAQEKTVSHGVDGLQRVCSDLLFFAPTWSKDTHEQAQGRLHRTGQTAPVNVTTLIANKTVDELVVKRLDDKGQYMKLFLSHIKK
jgi:SNF2 family DNA or RNA helicase